MLLKLSDKISECLAHAAEARERAKAATDADQKAHFLDMELRWLRLVESYRFVEQASRFLKDSHLARLPSRETLPQTGVLVVTCPTIGKDFSTGILTDTDSLALTPQDLTRSYCPHCGMEHAWLPKDAKLVPALPRGEWVEFADDEAAKTDSERGQGEIRVRAINTPISDLLDVLIRTAIATSGGDARAAFYIANGGTLHHITGMSEAYAKYVDGFVIGPQSLACGLAAATGKPIITRDVAEEPLWEHVCDVLQGAPRRDTIQHRCRGRANTSRWRHPRLVSSGNRVAMNRAAAGSAKEAVRFSVFILRRPGQRDHGPQHRLLGRL